jgi:Uma2 family endonuclease
MIRVLAEELSINVESSGSATWKRKRDERGTEPDCCFHIANADRVIGRDELDLDKDPPPDLVVEVDFTNESNSKLEIYLAFKIPEVWRYIASGKTVRIYERRRNSYIETERSRAFPMLNGKTLGDFIEESKTVGQTQALTSFRKWLRLKTASPR